eukprot:scaffold421287_cov61-Attheya_sp.AAC.5
MDSQGRTWRSSMLVDYTYKFQWFWTSQTETAHSCSPTSWTARRTNTSRLHTPGLVQSVL